MTTYYPINENLVRASHDMRSMSTYPDGYATREYRASVDKAAALVEEKKQKVSPYYHEKLDALLDSYARRLAQWTDDHNRNGASCPSVLVCGLVTSRCERSRSRTPARIRFGTNMKKSKPS